MSATARSATARRVVAVLVAVAIVVAGSAIGWLSLHHPTRAPGCVVSATTGQPGAAGFVLTPEQASNAATIAAVGMRLGMPDHAVTVALATALQESGLRNLAGGDRDSAGLFQQRPSQGWGTLAQVRDPIYAATAFYERLSRQSGWQQLSVTEAAQQVQRSAFPDAYAQWEPEASATAAALTGQWPAAFSCHDLTVTTPGTEVSELASTELGTTAITGPHSEARGWALGSWLVAHAVDLGVTRVTFDGRTWTAASGTWARTGPADGRLTMRGIGHGNAS